MRWKPVFAIPALGALGLLFRARRRGGPQLRLLDAIEFLSNPGFRTGSALGPLKREATDWELVEEGGDSKDGYKYSEPTKCECGLSWDVTSSDAFFNAKPNAGDITACFASFDYPKKASEPCDPPCVAVEQSRHERWRIFKNKKTGQFWLYCSKRIQWHCEKVVG
jgi:hypothetical protein